MKKIIFYIAVIIFVAVSCTEDKGTYDYVALNEVTISEIQDQYIALSEEAFSITPKVEQKQVKDESVLEYLWYAHSKGQAYSADTLARTKDLSLTSLMLVPAEYELVFRVTDTSTEVYYDYRSKISVKGFTDGLEVLSNNANYAQVSILRGVADGLSDFEAYKLKNNGEVAGENPVSIIGIKNYYTKGKPFRMPVYCNDSNLGSYATGDKLEKTIKVTEAFVNNNAPTSITGILGDPLSNATGVFGDNKLYTTYLAGFWPSGECEFRNSFDDISPNFKSAQRFEGFILFNTSTTGFVKIDKYGWRMTTLPASTDADAPFDRANTGLDPIYGKTVSEVYSMGVFEDPADQKRYLLALQNTHPAFKKEIVGDNLANATLFEFFNSKQVLLYAFENKIYSYDVVANKVLFTYEAPEGVTIDCMEISNDDKKLFVGFGNGTNAANSGSVHILNIDLDGEILGVHEAYDNKFGKVVDFFENY